MTHLVVATENFQHPLKNPQFVLTITDSMREAFDRNLKFIATEHVTTPFATNHQDLFTAFRIKSDKLFDHYLSLFPEEQRQTHTCNCCRQFMQKYGGLVAINKDGELKSLVWDFETSDPHWKGIVEGMREHVEKRAVASAVVMKSSSKVAKFGKEQSGGFSHLSLHPNVQVVLESPLFEHHYPIAYIADLLNKYGAGDGYGKLKLAKTALTAGNLNSPTLFQWAIDFLYDRIEHINAAKLNPRQVLNLTYRYAVEASRGLFHLNETVVDVLLNRGVAAANATTAGEKYMRPTRESMAEVEREKCNALIEELGLAPSFERQYATLDEIRLDWTHPAEPVIEAVEKPKGFFDSVVKTDKEEPAAMIVETVDGGFVTYRHFKEKLLPQAKAIWAHIDNTRSANFACHVTALHPDAPQLMGHDRDDDRYPISFFSFVGGSVAAMWGHKAKTQHSWVEVTGIKEYFAGFLPRHLANAGDFPVATWFGLKGFKALDADTAATVGNAIFPAACREEIRTNSSMRLAVEKFSKSAVLHNPERANAIGMFSSGGQITARENDYLTLRIDIGSGLMQVKIRSMS